jgi:beta-glucosidase
MGKEMKAVGANANAGPAMNIIRDPRTGRSFEYFTEDPFINGKITAAYTRGIQSEKIAATLKHYICNNQELNRGSIDISVSERALREIYLPGFGKAVKDTDAKIIMGAYNKVNGVYSCENSVILQDILRGEWGFDGFVLSDWNGTQSTVDSANNGLDVEMPREKFYGKKLLDAVENGQVSKETIDNMVRNVLRVVFWSGVFDEKRTCDKSFVRTPEHLAVARNASASSIVLLKNQNNLLPFDLNKVKKVAVIGPNGDYGEHFRGGIYHIGLFQGGGSSRVPVLKGNMVTPYIGIKNNVPADVEVSYAPGCYAESGFGNIPTRYLKTPDGKAEGLKVSYYGNANFSGKPIRTEVTKKLSYLWTGELDIPEAGLEMDDKNRFSIEFRSKLTAPATREYTFEVRNESGFAKIFIDGELVAENKQGSRRMWNDTGSVKLEKGKEYDLLVKFAKRGWRADLSINWDYENLEYLKEARKLAESSDAVILTVGLSGQMGETEAGDRRRMGLYPAQERLINEITSINENSAVVLVAGSAVTMDNWLDNASAVLTMWYPGEQGGNALADVLFGTKVPAGRLPITFAKSQNQYPEDFYSLGHEIEYKEGVFVGYRYFDENDMETLFPFGHGLSYTTFKYGRPKLNGRKFKVGDEVVVSIDITNTGDRYGAEVVQLYVHDVESSVARPPKELKAFKKVFLQPGETKKVKLVLDKRAFAFFSEKQNEWIVESGEFKLLIGSSSRDIHAKKPISLR